MNTTPLVMATSVARVVTFFETLTPDSVAGIGQIYDLQARFKDPFNEVAGVPAIQRIFDHMFASLHEPRFVVTQQVVQEEGPAAMRQCRLLLPSFPFLCKGPSS